jgi:hypothetical protein
MEADRPQRDRPATVIAQLLISLPVVSLPVCAHIWKLRTNSATSQNGPVQESTSESPERGVILLCANYFCHSYCGAEFTSLFCWHFGVAINVIGNQVSILFKRNLREKQLFCVDLLVISYCGLMGP